MSLCVWTETLLQNLVPAQMVESLVIFSGHTQTWLFLYRDF